MAPTADSGETLLDRSQRILGVSLDQSEIEKTRTRKSNVSPGRRREQVAQAQRTHRQRTQRYIRELENEVLRLRKLHKASENRNQLLLSQLQLLTESLVSNNLPLPGVQYPSGSESDGINSYSSSPFGSGISSPSLNIDISGLSTTTPEIPCSIIAAERIPVEIDASILKQDHIAEAVPDPLVAANAPTDPPADATAIPASLDPQAGIDFILELEHPCLPHVKYALETDLDIINPNVPQHNGPGHVFTATASLLYASQSPNPTSHPFSMPQNEIDRLLDASKRLNLENEMTPVQVWQKIKEISKANHISPMMLECLTKDFSKYAFCNSFGTVIDKQVAEVIFNYYFPSSTTQ